MGVKGFVTLVLVAFVATSTQALTTEEAQHELARRAAALQAANAVGVKGLDGWYFVPADLRSYGVGSFWGDRAAQVSRAAKDPDPLPALLEFNTMLKAAGIELILVPVPGKVAIYSDKLQPPLDVTHRIDTHQAELYEQLAKAGLTVVDLTPDFERLRRAGTAPYCKQDTHWSPQGVKLAAKKIATLIKAQRWRKAPSVLPVTITPQQVQVRGDIVATLLKDASVPPESLTLEQVKLGNQWVDADVTSPVVLMGDSHTLVFHRADLLGEHSGLSDHLAAELGTPVDLVGAMGGGANASRVALARRKDNLAGKKCVVWVFRASEFTETDEGWRSIPVIR